MVRVMPNLPVDDAAFAAFLAAHRERVLAFLRRLGGHEAEDLLQETLAKVWRHRCRLDPAANPRAWLLRAAFRTFLDQRRRRRRGPEAAEEVVRAAPDRRPCPVEIRDEIERGLLRLLPLERTLLLAFHAEGRTLRELAAAHHLPLNTIKSHLHRARRKLTEADHDEA
jgi:RNA polymerase sigma-70 factor (ECF subfamily)